MQHRLGADQDVGVADLGGLGVDVDARAAAGTAPPAPRATRVTPARSTRSRVAPHSAQTSGRSSARSQRSSAWHASHASSRKRPRRLSTQTAGPSASRSASASDSVSSPAPGGSSRRSTTSARGQPRASTSGGGASSSASGTASASTVGAGDTTDHDAPARARPFVQHVARVPRGRAFLLQRLVGVVDDDRGREIGHRRERGRCARRPRRSRPRAARRHASVRCRVGLVGVHERDRRARPGGGTARATARRDPSATRDDRRPVGRAHRRDQLPPIANGGRRTTTRPNRRRSGGRRRPRSDAGSVASGVGATWLGGDAERRTATRGPHQRQAIHSVEVDDVGGRAGGRDREHLEQAVASVSGVDVVGDDPAAHAPAVQRDAHDRADAHRRARARRERRSRRRARPR